MGKAWQKMMTSAARQRFSFQVPNLAVGVCVERSAQFFCGNRCYDLTRDPLVEMFSSVERSAGGERSFYLRGGRSPLYLRGASAERFRTSLGERFSSHEEIICAEGAST